MIISGKAAVSFGIAVFMAVFLVGSFEYSPKSQLLPLIISSACLIMALVQLMADLFPAFEQRFGVLRQRGLLGADQIGPKSDVMVEQEPVELPPAEAESTEPKPLLEGNALALATVASMLVFGLSLLYVPYFVAIPVFLLFMLIGLGRQNPIVSTLIAAGVGGFMFVLFDIVLNARM